MSLNNSNINGHLVPETISLKESEVILTYNTDNNFYSLKENLTVIPESAEEYLDYIVTEGKDIITYDKSSGLIKIKEGVTEGFGIITIKSKFPTKVKAELKIYVTKSQTIKIFNDIYHIDKHGSLFIDDRELKEVGKVKSIEVGHQTVYAITLDNRLYAWGYNYRGEVGNGSTEEQTTPYEIKEVGKVKSVKEYSGTVYAITEDDRLYAWGNNIQNTPYEFKEIGKIKSFEEKAGNFYLTTIDDRLFTWGKDGKVGNGAIPYEITEVEAYKRLEEYNGTFYAITEDNRLYAWGDNEYGQIGSFFCVKYDETTPYEIKEVGKVKSIKVYEYYNYNEKVLTIYAITEDDRLYAWGYNRYGQVGNGKSGLCKKQTTPYEIKEVGKVKSIKVYEYYNYNEKVLTVYAITEDDRLYAWGDNSYGQVGNGESSTYKKQTTPYEIKEVGKVKSIKVYKNKDKLTVYAITEDDRLYAWGGNRYGQVGNGSDEKQTIPYEIKEVDKVKSIEVYEHEYAITVYAITEDDRLYAWGNNYWGKVGNGSDEEQTTPYEVKEVGKVKSIEFYKNKDNLTVYAITEDDRLYAWGDNKDGEVGNGKSGYDEKQTTPYEIKEVGKVKSIEVGSTVYAITEDDRLYAWGYNKYGEVGNGKSGYDEKQTTPYEIKEVGKVKSIKVYEYFYFNKYKLITVYAITEDDRLYTWGSNYWGQVGNSSTKPQTTPYEIKEVGKVKSIEVYKNKDKLTVYAITGDDRLYAWGGNIQNTPYEFKEIGKIKSFEEKAGNFYLTTIDDRLFTWGRDSKVGNGAIPYEIKDVE